MSAILFNRDEVEHLEGLAERPRRLRGSQLLWVDVHGDSDLDTAEIAEAFDLDATTREHLSTPNKKPVFDDHGRYIHITTYSPREDKEGELHAVECVVGENWVITAHEQPIAVLEEFAQRVSGSGDTGPLTDRGFSRRCWSGYWAPTRLHSNISSSAWKSSTLTRCAGKVTTATSRR